MTQNKLHNSKRQYRMYVTMYFMSAACKFLFPILLMLMSTALTPYRHFKCFVCARLHPSFTSSISFVIDNVVNTNRHQVNIKTTRLPHYYAYPIFASSFTKTIHRNINVTQGSSKNDDDDDDNDDDGDDEVNIVKTEQQEAFIPPWNRPYIIDQQLSSKSSSKHRFRQHVNPLARQFQLPTNLTDMWPNDVYHNCTKPLHLDIGCGKGNFLFDLIKYEKNNNNDNINNYNYLGLEIRPLVVQYAKSKIENNHHNVNGTLDFIGCNANVDLERILNRYCYNNNHNNEKLLLLQRVTIQFPDPQFKAKRSKRKVVTNELVLTLAKYMPMNSIVFLQSDIQSVLDDMRARFRDHNELFCDELNDESMYIPDNIFNTPTEREISVISRNLPVYRALFTRTSKEII